MNCRKIVAAAVVSASASLVWAAEPVIVYPTEVGCYQCWLNPPGMMMIVR